MQDLKDIENQEEKSKPIRTPEDNNPKPDNR